MTYLDVLTRTSFPEQISKSTGPMTVIGPFWTLTLKLTQHFNLIYNIGKSDWKILRNIMKTAQDSYTITKKQIVRFQERMLLEKFQVDKIQNGRLSAIIHLARPDIVEYHENRSRYLHHYYKTNCKVSGEDAFWKKSTLQVQHAANRPLFTFTWPLFGTPC